MNQLFIQRGTFRLGMVCNGEVKRASAWEADPEGRTVLLGDIDSKGEDISIENASMYGMWQTGALTDEIRERLRLPEPEDLPDVRKIARAMREAGECICDYCEMRGSVCNICMLDEEDV